MSGLLEAARRGQPLSEIEIIDMHSHIGRAIFSIPKVTAKSIVKAMDRAGVSMTVTTALCPLLPDDLERANDEIIEATASFPGRLLGYYWGYPFDPAPSAVEAEERMSRFVGLKLHNVNGIDYTHQAYQPYLVVADERRMPVLLHTWGQESDFEQVGELSGRFPNVRLLLAHSGATDEEGYVRIANECENVFLELAMSVCPRGLVERLCQKVGARKLIWGSDVSFINQAHQLGKVLGAKIPDTEKELILGGNAREILDRVTRA